MPTPDPLWGTLVALVTPGVGTIVGAVVGLIIGAVMYYITDVKEVNGKSVRDNIKDYISNSWGGD